MMSNRLSLFSRRSNPDSVAEAATPAMPIEDRANGPADDEPELAFLYRRAFEERRKAEVADSPPAYRRHTELARMFERRIGLLYRQTGGSGCS
jgi:hypothetical protein